MTLGDGGFGFISRVCVLRNKPENGVTTRHPSPIERANRQPGENSDSMRTNATTPSGTAPQGGIWGLNRYVRGSLNRPNPRKHFSPKMDTFGDRGSRHASPSQAAQAEAPTNQGTRRPSQLVPAWLWLGSMAQTADARSQSRSNLQGLRSRGGDGRRPHRAEAARWTRHDGESSRLVSSVSQPEDRAGARTETLGGWRGRSNRKAPMLFNRPISFLNAANGFHRGGLAPRTTPNATEFAANTLGNRDSVPVSACRPIAHNGTDSTNNPNQIPFLRQWHSSRRIAAQTSTDSKDDLSPVPEAQGVLRGRGRYSHESTEEQQ